MLCRLSVLSKKDLVMVQSNELGMLSTSKVDTVVYWAKHSVSIGKLSTVFVRVKPSNIEVVPCKDVAKDSIKMVDCLSKDFHLGLLVLSNSFGVKYIKEDHMMFAWFFSFIYCRR